MHGIVFPYQSHDIQIMQTDGWMDDLVIFTSFSTVFQSYQDDGQLTMKGCEQWNPVYG